MKILSKTEQLKKRSEELSDLFQFTIRLIRDKEKEKSEEEGKWFFKSNIKIENFQYELSDLNELQEAIIEYRNMILDMVKKEEKTNA